MRGFLAPIGGGGGGQMRGFLAPIGGGRNGGCSGPPVTFPRSDTAERVY